MYAIYGTSGFGREVLPLVKRAYSGSEIVFIDDDPAKRTGLCNGHSVISLDQAADAHAQVVIAVGDSVIRSNIAKRCVDAGLSFFEVRAPDADRYDSVEIGEGAILCARSLITSNVKIGKHFHCNIYSYVAHDCVVGDFVTFAPRVCCNGNIVVEDFAYIGTGAFLKQGHPTRPLRIGRNAVVGMGAVVTQDVPPGAIVVGNPAREMVKRS